MTEDDGTSSRQDRTVAVLEKILAGQAAALAEQRRIAGESRELIEQSLCIQREMAERQRLAVDTQQRMVRLYRPFVAAGALLIALCIGLILWLLMRYF